MDELGEGGESSRFPGFYVDSDDPEALEVNDPVDK